MYIKDTHICLMSIFSKFIKLVTNAIILPATNIIQKCICLNLDGDRINSYSKVYTVIDTILNSGCQKLILSITIKIEYAKPNLVTLLQFLSYNIHVQLKKTIWFSSWWIDKSTRVSCKGNSWSFWRPRLFIFRYIKSVS